MERHESESGEVEEGGCWREEESSLDYGCHTFQLHDS